jgi:hypothetical protein
VFDPIERILTWTIGSLSAVEKEPFASITLSNSLPKFMRIDFACSFRVNTHSLSGIRIDGLRVQNESYTPFKGGRSYVKSGRIFFRI